MLIESALPARILVVEDTDEHKKILRGLLTDLPARVVMCEDGEEALQALRSPDLENDPYRIVILDRFIPRQLGEPMADLGIALLNAHQLLCPGTPVIVFTGYPTLQHCVESIKAGAYEYIGKNDSNRDGYETLLATCKRLLGMEEDPFDAWMARNGRQLERRYGGQYVSLLAPAKALAAGLHLEEIDGETILAENDIRDIRRKMLDNPILRWVMPRILRIPRPSE